MMIFKNDYQKKMDIVNNALVKIIKNDSPYSQRVVDAALYSINAGGKRLRPILLISSHQLLGGDINESLPLACGIEMIHTYSLIHDDLPAMDNDDFRRGKPTNHKIFGEAIAILAGDALLNMAYEIMLQNAFLYPHKIQNHIGAIYTIANAAGIRGMIGGQVADIEYQGKTVDDDLLRYIHKSKTGAIITASLVAGAKLEDPDKKTLQHITTYGNNIGLAFQIVDDILDVTGDFNDMGKKPGSDINENKATFPQLYGVEKSYNIAQRFINDAVEQLDIFGSRGSFLRELAYFIINRRG